MLDDLAPLLTKAQAPFGEHTVYGSSTPRRCVQFDVNGLDLMGAVRSLLVKPPPRLQDNVDTMARDARFGPPPRVKGGATSL